MGDVQIKVGIGNDAQETNVRFHALEKYAENTHNDADQQSYIDIDNHDCNKCDQPNASITETLLLKFPKMCQLHQHSFQGNYNYAGKNALKLLL